MKTIVTYKSKTGFTKKYAEWIADELNCGAIRVEELDLNEAYDCIIHGGWIMAGMILGLNKVKKAKTKHLVCFAVGFTQEKDYVHIIQKQNQIQNLPLYYFLGGTNPKKMNILMKIIVKAVTKQEIKDIDLSDIRAIQPLIGDLKEFYYD